MIAGATDWRDRIFQEDALQGLARIPDASIDLLLTDPPYGLGKEYGNDSDKLDAAAYLRWTEQWIDMALPKLKANGSLYIFFDMALFAGNFRAAEATDDDDQ